MRLDLEGECDLVDHGEELCSWLAKKRFTL